MDTKENQLDQNIFQDLIADAKNFCDFKKGDRLFTQVTMFLFKNITVEPPRYFQINLRPIFIQLKKSKFCPSSHYEK